MSVYGVRSQRVRMVQWRTSVASKNPVDVAIEKVGMVGESKAFKELRKSIDIAVAGTGPVLITGETGSGKELVAEVLHLAWQRVDFLNTQTMALVAGSDTFAISSLFGHVKGAYSDAKRDRRGWFRSTKEGGTIFLDELGELPLGAQAMLLRAIENGEVQPLGADKPEKLRDVRVLAATNANLWSMVEAGRFRRDLLARLSTFHIEVPPLQDRIDDLDAMIEHIQQKLLESQKIPCKMELDGEALKALKAHKWPGNIRELVHTLESAICSAYIEKHKTVRRENLPKELTREQSAAGAQSELGEDILRLFDNYRTAAGISRKAAALHVQRALRYDVEWLPLLEACRAKCRAGFSLNDLVKAVGSTPQPGSGVVALLNEIHGCLNHNPKDPLDAWACADCKKRAQSLLQKCHIDKDWPNALNAQETLKSVYKLLCQAKQSKATDQDIATKLDRELEKYEKNVSNRGRNEGENHMARCASKCVLVIHAHVVTGEGFLKARIEELTS